MIIDTHCHYNLEPLFTEWQTHWQKAQTEGVEKSLVVSANLESSQHAVDIVATEPNLWAAIGVHPTEFSEANPPELDRVEKTLRELSQNPKVIALGETGLDYFHLPTDDTRAAKIDAQHQAFRRHIHLAKDLQLPLLIHVRDGGDQAYWDILQVLQSEHFTQPFVLHCISGPIKYVQEAIEMGGYIGVAGNITYKNAEHLRDLVRSVPPDRVLLETDAPYLPPQQFRGQRCEPWMIRHTSEFVATEQNLPAVQLYQNTLKLFPQLKPHQ